ncbi:UNVERIFIED_CONTAM: Chmp2b [Trichonephila clavipes]
MTLGTFFWRVLTVLAKNLVTVRKQKARTYTASSKIMSVGNQTKTMGLANKELNPQGIMKTMHDFEKESMKMGMAEEIVEDSLNSVLTESGDEEEEDAVVNQVLDEIGIEISGKMSKAPLVNRDEVGESSRVATDDELERQLAKLKT